MSMDLQEWATRLHALAGPKLRAHLRQALVEFAVDAEGRAKENATRDPKVRTGSLRRSIAGTVKQGDALEAVLSAGGRTGGADLAYARIQELGGTVVPKKGRYLAIPMPAAQTKSGVARGGPRDFPDLRFQPGRDGSTAWLVRDVGRGKSRRSELMFKLVRKVEIRPKHYLRAAFEAAQREMPDHIGAVVTTVLPRGQ